MPNPGFEERDRRPGAPGAVSPTGAGARPSGAERVPSSGRTIAGRYRLDRVLGKGSMGTVWAAYDETLQRRVAIKEIYVPAGTPGTDAAMLVERTLREARAIAQLSHPNVITLYDILTLNTGPVIVMEVLAARSLGEVLKEVGPLTVGQTATVGLAVAAGLSAAHAAGITHRDVKPGNVLIGADGRIKLTDFGIARSAAENPMTATGLLLGSPAYIAPEVASGATAGPAADAWGLGALLFACVEGAPPFDKGSPVATLMSVVNDPVPAPRRAAELAPVIEGLLEKDPGLRLSLRQARAALRPLATDPAETRLVFESSVIADAVRTSGTPDTRPADAGAGPRQTAAFPVDRPGARPGVRPGATGFGTTGTGLGVAGGGLGAAGGGLATGGGLSATGLGATGLGATGAGRRPDAPPPTARMRPPWVDQAPPRTAGGTSTFARDMAAAGIGVDAGSVMPPPPWAASGAAALAPLPSGRDRARATAGTGTRWWIAAVVFLTAALIAFFGVRAIADSVGDAAAVTSSPAPAMTTLSPAPGLPSGLRPLVF